MPGTDLLIWWFSAKAIHRCQERQSKQSCGMLPLGVVDCIVGGGYWFLGAAFRIAALGKNATKRNVAPMRAGNRPGLPGTHTSGTFTGAFCSSRSHRPPIEPAGTQRPPQDGLRRGATDSPPNWGRHHCITRAAVGPVLDGCVENWERSSNFQLNFLADENARKFTDSCPGQSCTLLAFP